MSATGWFHSLSCATPVVRRLVWLWLVCAAVPAVAATDTDLTELSLKELMALEVFRSASLLPTEQVKAPGTVYSFNRGDFERFGARRLEDLLQLVPGLQLNQYRKRHRSIWARGLLDRYNDKLVFLIDGVRIQHLYYGHFALGDNLPLEKVEKVEVILGPASSLYGANAFGGIVAITTRGFADSTSVEATAEYGSNDRLKGTLLYNTRRLQMFASYLDQEAPFREDRRSFIGGDTEQPLDEEYGNIFIKMMPFDGLTLSLDYSRNDTPFLFIPDTQDAFIEERPLSLMARYEWGDAESGRIEADLHYTRDEAREYELEQQTRRLGYLENQDAALAGSTVTGFKRLWDRHILALGVSWQHRVFEDTDWVRYFHYSRGFLDPPDRGDLLSQPGVSNDDYAVYLQDVWQVSETLEMTLGARFDEFDDFGSHFNYRGALVYSPNSQQTWKVLYGTGIRTPAYREYLKVLEGTDFEPQVPDPERIETIELGFHHQWDQASLAVTLFDNEVHDFIHEVPTPDGADEYFANSDNPWRLRGGEVLVQWRLHRALQLRLGVGYLDAEERGSGALPYLASWNGSLNLDYRLAPDHRIGLTLFYNSERDDTNSYDDDQPDAFSVVNLFGSGEIDDGLSYSWGIDNLFDEQVFDPAADFGGQYNTERSTREAWVRLHWIFHP